MRRDGERGGSLRWGGGGGGMVKRSAPSRAKGGSGGQAKGAASLDEGVFNTLLEKKPKGKRNARKTAPDPRLDPSICPKKAKRIIANRASAARSKAKQKKHLENLKTMHQTLFVQKNSIQQEIDSIQSDARRVERENQSLIERLNKLSKKK